MPVYRLIPTDIEHPDWEISSHKERCLIHAPDDKQARTYADAEFLQVEVAPGFDLRRSPWLNPVRTNCEILTGANPENYREGQIEIPSSGDTSGGIGVSPIATGPIGGGEVGGWKVIKPGKSSTESATETPPPLDGAANIAIHGREQLKAEFAATSGTGETTAPPVDLDAVVEAKAGLGAEAEVVRSTPITKQTVTRTVANREVLLLQARSLAAFLDAVLETKHPRNAPDIQLWEPGQEPAELVEVLKSLRDELRRFADALEKSQVDTKQLPKIMGRLRDVAIGVVAELLTEFGGDASGFLIAYIGQLLDNAELVPWDQYLEYMRAKSGK